MRDRDFTEDSHDNHEEDKKYFTPSIEDIRVGYECEIKQRGLGFLDWTPYTIHSKYAFYHYFDDSGSASIRVPYLTKEQIEAEGWTKSQTEDFFRKPFWILTTYFDECSIRLESIPFSREDDQTIRFHGECKDINTFRHICKLLGI